MTKHQIVCTRSTHGKISKSTSYMIGRIMGVLLATFFVVNVAGVGVQLFAVWLILRPPSCETQK